VVKTGKRQREAAVKAKWIRAGVRASKPDNVSV